MGIKKAAAAVVKSPAGQAVAKVEIATAKGLATAAGRGDLVPGIEEAGKKLTGDSGSGS
ncbi:hypothetical protein [Ktedonobacter racemifer]|uniref:Uncharacterized protein n=1 Tax=Ktedonobacter racemifer DSM 44963 TaxID=485913 RepID=D6TW93_KTERA|nr:hypothetical protein [Ktedonobacter racemifer]EFH84476.1 conserved hypothetical protein [Ktedonobacter racemifer DSM 44963]